MDIITICREKLPDYEEKVARSGTLGKGNRYSRS